MSAARCASWSRRVVKAPAIVAFAVALVYFLANVVGPGMRMATGFAGYYTAAHLALEGRADVRLYDDGWFGDEMEKAVGPGVRDVFTTAPPASALIMLPLAGLSFASVRLIWLTLDTLWLLAAVWIVMRESNALDRSLLASGAAIGALLAAPTFMHFVYGQVYIFLLFWHVVAWAALRQGNSWIAGLALGLTMGLKLSGWPIWVLLAWRRQWRALGWGLIVVGLLVATSATLVGLDAWRDFVVNQVPRNLGWPAAPLTAYQTTTGFFQHLFRFDPDWNLRPIVDAPWLASPLSIGVTLGALWLTAKHARSIASLFVLALALTSLLNPIAEEYHYVLFTLPLGVMWVEVAHLRPPSLVLLASAATALLTLFLDYENPALANGWMALLAYPRLYGGWLTWGVLLWLEMRRGYEPAPA